MTDKKFKKSSKREYNSPIFSIYMYDLSDIIMSSAGDNRSIQANDLEDIPDLYELFG